MSQQKLFFALVLVAGCVALASGQGMDVNECIQSGQKLVTEYTETLQTAFSKFTDTASKNGQSAFDVQKLNDQANQILKELRGLINPNGFNFDQTMSAWMRIVRLQTGLATSAFNPAAGISVGRAYMELLNTLMTTNSNFALTLTSSCVPQLRNVNGAAY